MMLCLCRIWAVTLKFLLVSSADLLEMQCLMDFLVFVNFPYTDTTKKLYSLVSITVEDCCVILTFWKVNITWFRMESVLEDLKRHYVLLNRRADNSIYSRKMSPDVAMFFKLNFYCYRRKLFGYSLETVIGTWSNIISSRHTLWVYNVHVLNRTLNYSLNKEKTYKVVYLYASVLANSIC